VSGASCFPKALDSALESFVIRSWYPLALTALATCLVAPCGYAQMTRLSTLPYRIATQSDSLIAPPPLPDYVDLDSYISGPATGNMPYDPGPYDAGLYDVGPYGYAPPTSAWDLQVLPDGLIYDNYLAGVKESRLSAHIYRGLGDSTYFDATLGARIGLLRYGTHDVFRAEGWQIDVEGSGQLRLDIPEDVDVTAADFRAGMPITYGVGKHRWKLAYYHLSSHVGDEFLIKNPAFTRLNYSRDVFVLGYAHYFNPKLRAYGEAGWAFYDEISRPWEFQVGIEHAPCGPTGLQGEAFFALNGHFREEVDFGGSFEFQLGWAWRGDESSNMLRMGMHYYNGKSNQFSFFNEHEQQIGFGLWYDF
jgi:hypothetical protein